MPSPLCSNSASPNASNHPDSDHLSQPSDRTNPCIQNRGKSRYSASDPDQLASNNRTVAGFLDEWRDKFYFEYGQWQGGGRGQGGGEQDTGEPLLCWDAQHLAQFMEARPLEWIVPNLIPRGEVTLLAGDAKIGKSFFTLDLAQRLATGKPFGLLPFTSDDFPADNTEQDLSDPSNPSNFFNAEIDKDSMAMVPAFDGHNLPSSSPNSLNSLQINRAPIGTVLLNLEDGDRLLGNRFLQMRQAGRLVPKNLIQVVKAMEFRDRIERMRAAIFATKNRGKYQAFMDTGAFDPNTMEGQITLRMNLVAKRLQWHLEVSRAQGTGIDGIDSVNCGLIVLDPAIEILGVTDENSSSQVAASIAPLRQLAQQENVAVLLVHHNSKAGSIRGSTAFQASVNTILRLNKNSLGIASKSFSPNPRILYYTRNPNTLRYEFRRGGNSKSSESNHSRSDHSESGAASPEKPEKMDDLHKLSKPQNSSNIRESAAVGTVSETVGNAEHVQSVKTKKANDGPGTGNVGVVATRQTKILRECDRLVRDHDDGLTFQELGSLLRRKGMTQGVSDRSIRRLICGPQGYSTFSVDKNLVTIRKA